MLFTGAWNLYAMLLPFAGVILLLLIDSLLAPKPDDVQLETQVPTAGFLGEPVSLLTQVIIEEPVLARRLTLRLEAQGPIEVPADQEAFHVTSSTELQFELHPHHRGDVLVRRVWIRWTGPLGLMERISPRLVNQTFSVIANTRAVRRAAIRLATHQTFINGVKTERRRGDGSEFETLRKYETGLDHRFIDWKASARHHKLLWREHRTERNHNVILAIDTGRLMAEPIAGMPRLDHAINSSLLLAFLSLRMGDNVGLFAFDSTVRAFHPPHRGTHTSRSLAQAAATLTYSEHEANYTLAITELARRVQRRSIIIVMTEFMDSIAAELLIENMTRLARKHLVVFVALRDPYLDDVLNLEPRNLIDVGKTTVAFELLKERQVVLHTLQKRGIFCVDATPKQVSVDLLNRYLDIHRRELV
jgi:uncharacterized protein (DUF58 family)